MRLRRKPEAQDFLLEHQELYISNPQEWKGKFSQLFHNNQPIRIEIGMGKGDFIYELAKRNPNINYIGIEKYDTVLYIACKKIVEEGVLPNLRLMCFDATNLLDVFDENEIDRLYLNFSDPWPKKRHYKRRLTYRGFLKIYEHILIDKGVIEFKTDNRILFESTLMEFNAYPLVFDLVSLNLHDSEYMEDNIITEYEAKFSPFGPIYKLVAHFKGE